jgi:hypothetical protein
MVIYRKRINGRKVWWVRVNYRRLNASRVCESSEAAKNVEAELREGLRRKVEHTDRAGLQPATLKALFEGYVADLEARGKGPDTVGRAAQTAKAFEAVLPALLPAAVGQFKERDVFAFREARARGGVKPSTINRDLRTIRAMQAGPARLPLPGRRLLPSRTRPGSGGSGPTRSSWCSSPCPRPSGRSPSWRRSPSCGRGRSGPFGGRWCTSSRGPSCSRRRRAAPAR